MIRVLGLPISYFSFRNNIQWQFLIDDAGSNLREVALIGD